MAAALSLLQPTRVTSSLLMSGVDGGSFSASSVFPSNLGEFRDNSDFRVRIEARVLSNFRKSLISRRRSRLLLGKRNGSCQEICFVSPRTSQTTWKRNRYVIVRASLSGAPGEPIPVPSDDFSTEVAGVRGGTRGGRTRLGRLFSDAILKLQDRWEDVRRGLWVKVFLLLLGFFSANSISTIIGQTGDWDVLVAGFIVAILELQGTLLYKFPIRSDRPLMKFIRYVLQLSNYWKAGFIYGLYVDAFKVGS